MFDTSKEWKDVRKFVWKRDNATCTRCKDRFNRTQKTFEVHHKNHSSLNNTDYNQVTSYLSAIHAIIGYIQKEMQNENSLNFQIYHRTGWTEGISDTQRYKCCGNAVTVPVVQWIASHFEFPKDLA